MVKVKTDFAQLVRRKEAADERDFTNKEIAAILTDLGELFSEAAVARWRRGENFEGTPLRKVAVISEWLGCEIGDLLYIERDEEPA